jgi:hypothetical protein
MSRRKKSNYRGWTRPAWRDDVDRWLYRYADLGRAMENLEAELAEFTATGQRTVMAYESMEAQRSLSPSGPQENMVLRAEELDYRIQEARGVRQATLDHIAWAFTREELASVMDFIHWFWWTKPREPERYRKALVVINLEWVTDRQYQRLKSRIYDRLGETLGYKPIVLPSQKNNPAI